VTVPRVGHASYVEDASQFDAALLDFLEAGA
jgi:pimeloyl-ACP methyl ester carboxylesterase